MSEREVPASNSASRSLTYRTIVADPPWQMPSGGHHNGTGADRPAAISVRFAQHSRKPSQLPYATLTLDAIKALPVASLAEKDAHLYLWVPNAFLEHAHAVVRAWGFKPSTMLVWAKAPRGIGLGGAFTNTTEFVLFARRGSLRALTRSDTTWWHWTRPFDGRMHSAKPDAFQDIVENVSPGPYLELFARRQRLGWDVWGNEVESDVQMAVA